MNISEEQLGRWAQAPSETQNEKCENAITSITDALRSHFGDDIYIIRQGSHRNRTNTKVDSDVDIAVVHSGYYFPDLRGLSETDRILYNKNRTPANYLFSQFKNDVHSILQRKFVTERKNKCIRVEGSSYRVNADVVPAYEHKRYSAYNVVSAEGIGFSTDRDERIFSFPEQHYANGISKNDKTSRSYKAVVRILKNIRNKFIDSGVMASGDVPSFFIESLVWNVPNDYFFGNTWREIIESITAKIWNDMRNVEVANKYAEASNLQWLFHSKVSRTHKQAEDFMLRAWKYIKN